MPYAARLNDSATVNRPIFAQSDTGLRFIDSWGVQSSNQRCHLQINDFEAILQEFGAEVKAEAVCYFLKDVNLRPKIGASAETAMDRVVITQADGTITTWMVKGVLYRTDKRGGYAVAALDIATGAS